MHIELLYFDDCPNWKVADERLARALELLGRTEVVVERRRVETHEEAVRLGFAGSPTILVDGVDPFASGAEAFGLACRMYVTPTGRSGAPETEQLVEALA